jgi:ribosomal protein L29
MKYKNLLALCFGATSLFAELSVEECRQKVLEKRMEVLGIEQPKKTRGDSVESLQNTLNALNNNLSQMRYQLKQI